jgi:hypothetical protein
LFSLSYNLHKDVGDQRISIIYNSTTKGQDGGVNRQQTDQAEEDTARTLPFSWRHLLRANGIDQLHLDIPL